MIVNIRGTSGSGKTTLVRRLMAQCGPKVRVREKGKKKIIGYLCPHPQLLEQGVAFVGSYENPTGGCDTIGGPNSMDQIFGLVKEGHARGFHVIYEGLLVSADQKRTHELHTLGLPVQVVCLEVPIDLCVESINMRRRARKGQDAEPVNPRNTESKWHQTKKAARWLTERGVPLTWCDRDSAFNLITDLLKLEKHHVPQELVQRESPPPAPRARAVRAEPPRAEQTPRTPDLSAR